MSVQRHAPLPSAYAEAPAAILCAYVQPTCYGTAPGRSVAPKQPRSMGLNLEACTFAGFIAANQELCGSYSPMLLPCV